MWPFDNVVTVAQAAPPELPKEIRMQTRLTRSWTALRYDLSSQRALDNAARTIAEHDRLLAEIDALAHRLDAAAAESAAASEQRRSRDVA